MKICSVKDFYGGLLFVISGLLALIVSSSYPKGDTMHMGPGYFPSMIGLLLILVGIVIAIKGLFKQGAGIKDWALRPLVMVSFAVVAFALLIKPLGLVLATLALVLISCLASSEFRIREIVVLSLLLAAFVVGVFIYGVGLPLKVWPT